MKKLFAILIILSIFCGAFTGVTFTVKANALTEGIFTYTVADGKATLIEVAPSAQSPLIIPANLGGYPVTTIGESAFQQSRASIIILSEGILRLDSHSFTNTHLWSVTLPESLKEIGEAAFWDSGLQFVNIPPNVTTIGRSAFALTNISSIVIPDSTKNLGTGIFSGCESLLSVTFGKGVTEIPDSTFSSCTKLDTIEFGANITKIGDYAFSNCRFTNITIPNSVKELGEGTFSSCVNLKSIHLPDGISVLPAYTFKRCYALDDIRFPANLKIIDSNCFESCSSIKDFVIPDTVTAVGANAFRSCDNLESLTIGRSVTQIGLGSCYECPKLKRLNAYSIEQLCKISYHDEGCNPLYYVHNLYVNGKKITALEIPEGVTYISPYAFAGGQFTSVKIPSSVTKIGRGAFYDCTKLTNITIPKSVKTIEREAFYNCSSITAVTLDRATTEISEDAFLKCDKIENVYYTGNKTDRNNISNGSGKYLLSYCKWHYNICNNKHTVNKYIELDKEQHYGYCTICPYTDVASHTWDNGVVTKNPTNKTQGEKTFTCTACKASKTEFFTLTNNNPINNTNTPTSTPDVSSEPSATLPLNNSCTPTNNSATNDNITPTPTSTNTPPIPDNKENTNTLGIVVAVFGGACVLSCGIFITVTVIKRKNKK